MSDPIPKGVPNQKDQCVAPNREAMAALATRMGRAHLRQRLYLQTDHAARIYERTRFLQRLQDGWMYTILRNGLKWTGLYGWGLQNARRLEVRHNDVSLAGLPASFDGFRILHLSDLHLDIDEVIAGAIQQSVETLDYDLCVMTGDFRNHTHGGYREMLASLGRLIQQMRAPAYAVLGNHDYIEFIPPLEAAGLRFLMNETVAIRKDEEVVYLSGVDDAYFYAAHDLFKARDTIPEEAVSILLSHSPSIYRTASACGWDLMLSGHTHGGQICLPGSFAILKPSGCPRRFLNGAWRYGRMHGYTSVGAGCSMVPVRFFCPPEVAVHTLRRKKLERRGENTRVTGVDML